MGCAKWPLKKMGSHGVFKPPKLSPLTKIAVVAGETVQYSEIAIISYFFPPCMLCHCIVNYSIKNIFEAASPNPNIKPHPFSMAPMAISMQCKQQASGRVLSMWSV